MSITNYEKTQTNNNDINNLKCRLEKNEPNYNLISKYFNENIINILNNLNEYENKVFINTIGSPSQYGIVYKITFDNLMFDGYTYPKLCYALKIMPYINESLDNRQEIAFANYLSNLDNKKFPIVYFTALNQNFISSNSIGQIDLDKLYDYNSQNKKKSHKNLLDKIKEYNIYNNIDEKSFKCDIMISRIYWGDLISLLNEKVIIDENINNYNGCKSIDYCNIINKIKIDKSILQKFLKKIIQSIKTLRIYNLYHKDLHCGNILIDFNGNPIIHDFGQTIYDISNNKYIDTLDIGKLFYSISLEINNGLNKNIIDYLNYITKEINKFIQNIQNNIEIDNKILDKYRNVIIHNSSDTIPNIIKNNIWLEDNRNNFFDNIIKIIYSEPPEFDLFGKLRELGLPVNITFENFKKQRISLIRQGKIELFNEILNNWINIVSGGNIKRITKRNTKYKKYISKRKLK